MRKITSILLPFFILFSCIPQASAEDSIRLYNHGNEVVLTNPIELYLGVPYIELSDLENIDLVADERNNELWINSYNGDLIIYRDSIDICYNNSSMIYRNALKVFNDLEYISLDLIAMCFSKQYSFENNVIELYTLSLDYGVVNGRISLPQGDVADKDLKVTIFVADDNKGIIGSLAENRKAGFSGTDKPKYIATDENYIIYVEEEVVIKKGETYANFTLLGTAGDFRFSDCIGYKIDGDNYQNVYTKYFHYASDKYQSLEIERNLGFTLFGEITLTEIAQTAEQFTIAAKNGDNTYIGKGRVEAGSSIGNYSIELPRSNVYTFTILSDSGKYLRQTLAGEIFVPDINPDPVDFSLNKSYGLNVSLTLPDGVETVEEVTITLQSATKPYYYLDEKTVNLSDPTVTLYDDMNCNDYICYYEFETEVEGLYGYGHYAERGTTTNAGYAKTFKQDLTDVEMPMLKKNTVNVTVKLPDGKFSYSNLYGNVKIIESEVPYDDSNFAVVPTLPEADDDYAYIVPPLTSDDIVTAPLAKTAGSGASTDIPPLIYVSTQNNILISSGYNQKTHTVTYPDDPYYNYYIEVTNNYKSGHTQYYTTKTDTNSTFFEENADVINKDNVTMTLMPQNMVSGVFSTDLEDLTPSLAMYAQLDNGKTVRVSRASYNSVTGEYMLYVPAECNKYILYIQAGITQYYTNGKTTVDIEQAEILNITEDTNIDVYYESYNPTLPIKISTPGDVYEKIDIKGIKLSNMSDYDKRYLTLFGASYDRYGKMTALYKQDIEPISAGETVIIYPGSMSKQLKDNYITKLFVWSDVVPKAEVSVIPPYEDLSYITRAEIAKELVELYEKVLGREIVITEEFSYIDTKDINALKMHQLEVLVGYEDNTFCPDDYMTNSEIVTVINRTLKKMGYQFTPDNEFVSVYDFDKSHWAYNYLIELEQAGLLYEAYQSEFLYNEAASKATVSIIIDECYNLF